MGFNKTQVVEKKHYYLRDLPKAIWFYGTYKDKPTLARVSPAGHIHLLTDLDDAGGPKTGFISRHSHESYNCISDVKKVGKFDISVVLT